YSSTSCFYNYTSTTYIYLLSLHDALSILYRNLGNWKFEDITASAGVACSNQFSTGALLADVDGDGHLDLLVNSIGGGTRLFINEDRKSTRLNSSHVAISYAVFCLKKKKST